MDMIAGIAIERDRDTAQYMVVEHYRGGGRFVLYRTCTEARAADWRNAHCGPFYGPTWEDTP
jgi:hypothetical protein